MEDIVVDLVVVDHARYRAVLVCGEIDCYTGPGLHARLLDIVDGTDRPLVVDMSGVPFCDGSALRAMYAIQRHCADREVLLAVVGLRPYVEKLFRTFELDERIPICATSQEALWCLLPPTDAEIESWLDEG